MKIHLVGDAALQAQVFAAELPGVALSELPRDATADERFDTAIGPDDVVVTMRFKRPGGAPPFRLLHVQGAGLDGIDFTALRQGCTVCNVFEHEGPVAEYVLMHMLRWEIRPEAMRFTAAGWGEAFRTRPHHGELEGRTLAIIGFGRIGRAVAKRARAFGVRVAVLDRSLDVAARALVDDVVPAADLKALLAPADYVMVSCPLNEKTAGLIGKAELAAMKPTGVLINAARAGIVDEQALYDALLNRRIGGAVLDVWYRTPIGSDDNPLPADLPFLDLPNAVCTPHSSAWTAALPGRRFRFIAANIRRMLAGEKMLNVVWPRETAV
jgi:phosphoglycerate dehydrogenase-like enzyme